MSDETSATNREIGCTQPRDGSRTTELRQALIKWQQTREMLRASLRFLAAQLRTTPEVLTELLSTVDKWGLEERIRYAERRADEIRAEAQAQGRRLTTREVIDSELGPHLLKMIAEYRQEY